MEWEFPKKALSGMPSMIRDVAEAGKKIPGFISLAIGNPAPEAIPVDIIEEAGREVLDGDPMEIMQYGSVLGDIKLREMTRKRLIEEKHLPSIDHDIILTSGSGEALGLVPLTLCSEGDEVFVDQFSYPNAMSAMLNCGLNLIGVEMDDYGMVPEALEESIKKSKKGKYIYLIPNFHNPTGITMPVERRKAIYEIACKYNLLIYEDDPYGDICFSGNKLPPIASMDTEGRVLYAGSFSKILSAGLRVGYLYGNSKLIDVMLTVRSNCFGQSSPLLTQMIVEKSFEKINLQPYLKRLSALYYSKCKVMIDSLKENCAPDVKINEPDGGMFLWVTLPERIDINDYYEKAMKEGVGIVRSLGFAADKNIPGNSFRLNFTSLPVDKIMKACIILGKLTK